MKAKQSVVRLTMGCVFALGLVLSLHSQAQEYEPGTFYSAKDPDLPPWPFNPYPELESVEVEPGIFLIDDTMLPDTPEQIESRNVREEAEAWARELANNPTLAAQVAAEQQAAREAVFAVNRAKVQPWLLRTLELPSTPVEPEPLTSVVKRQLVPLMGDLEVQQAQSGIVQKVVELEGVLKGISIGVPGAHQMLQLDNGLTDADTISTDEIWPGGSTGLDLTGTNTVMGLWEASGVPLLTHQEYSGRVTVQDGTLTTSGHATEVATVITASGDYVAYVDGTPYPHGAKGMSYAGRVFAYNSANDILEMAQVFSTNDQVRVSNHSYSSETGWRQIGSTWYWFGTTNVSQTTDWKFGAYTAGAANADWFVWAAQRHLPVWTPGNSRGDGPSSQPVIHRLYINETNQPWISGVVRNLDGDAGGYDSIHPEGVAKNVLTVGAVWPITGGYQNPSTVVDAYFSPYGPTDDGRIKPDVVAQGVYVLVGTSAGTTNYGFDHGTSFAAPGVSGSVNLLAQEHEQLHPGWRSPLASTLKGLVLHTADEAGTNAGPDFGFGWGLMNTERAADLVYANATNGWKTFIKETLLPNGGGVECPFAAPGGQDLKFTIVWSDPPGSVQSESLDNPAPRLVNDIDLRVISPNGTTNFPYVLDPDLTNQMVLARSAAATRGDNTRDNVEQVVITNAPAGDYLVVITHKGTLYNQGPQWTTLLSSGVQAQSKPALILDTPVFTATNRIALVWPSVVGQLYQIDYRTSLDPSASWATVPGELCAIRTNTAAELVLGSGVDSLFFRVKEVE